MILRRCMERAAIIPNGQVIHIMPLEAQLKVMIINK